MPSDSVGVFNHIIAVKHFTFKDQIKFSKLSGDSNPVHLDAVAARRTISGQRVVHGIHSLIWALDALAKEKGVTALTVSIKFSKPIFLEEEITNNPSAPMPVCREQSFLTSRSILCPCGK